MSAPTNSPSKSLPSAALETNRQTLEATEHDEPRADRLLGLYFEVADHRQELFEQHTADLPGGVGAQTLMGTCTKPEMACPLAVNVELVRVVERALVTIRGGEKHKSARALRNPDARHLNIRHHLAGKAGSGSIPPHRLLDGRVDKCLVGAHSFLLARVQP